MKIKIYPESVDLDRPYLHLQPIVDFIIITGNISSKDQSGFYLTQGGWFCDFRLPINYEMIQQAFDLPGSVRFGSTENAILCDNSWAEIRGNVG